MKLAGLNGSFSVVDCANDEISECAPSHHSSGRNELVQLKDFENSNFVNSFK